MRRFLDGLQEDILLLFGLVLALLVTHVALPADDLIARLAGEGFAAFLALLARRDREVAR